MTVLKLSLLRRKVLFLENGASFLLLIRGVSQAAQRWAGVWSALQVVIAGGISSG
jgi:hypothetical protein